MRFMFWNLQRKDLFHVAEQIGQQYVIDFIAVIEVNELLNPNFRNQLYPNYTYLRSNCNKVHLYSQVSSTLFSDASATDRSVIKVFKSPVLGEDILLAFTHGISKHEYSSGSQLTESEIFVDTIMAAESLYQTKKTVVVGDLNMNPFEEGLIKTTAFHAVLDKNIALKEKRKVQSRDYEYFYNPMWKFFSNQNGPMGTFFYSKADHVVYNWNIFDQVLIRPSMIRFFKDDELQIVSSVGNISLTKKNHRINSRKYSDHLPIIFELNI